MLIDTVQGQIWIEEEELDKAEALLRAAVQQCLTYNVPTTLAMCTGVLGSALARNGKASEAATLLERGFADRIYDAAGTYGRTFMRIGLGVAYRNLERLEDAIRVGRKAVEQAGEEYGHKTEALFELAETLRMPAMHRSAEDCFMQTYESASRLGMPYYGSALRQPSHIAATIGTEHENPYQQTRYFAAGRTPLPLWSVLLAESSHHRLASAWCIASAFSFRRRMVRRGGARQRRQRCDDETAKLFEHRTRAQPGFRRISDRHGSRPHLLCRQGLLDERLDALEPTLPASADQEAQRLVADPAEIGGPSRSISSRII